MAEPSQFRQLTGVAPPPGHHCPTTVPEIASLPPPTLRDARFWLLLCCAGAVLGRAEGWDTPQLSHILSLLLESQHAGPHADTAVLGEAAREQKASLLSLPQDWKRPVLQASLTLPIPMEGLLHPLVPTVYQCPRQSGTDQMLKYLLDANKKA